MLVMLCLWPASLFLHLCLKCIESMLNCIENDIDLHQIEHTNVICLFVFPKRPDCVILYFTMRYKNLSERMDIFFYYIHYPNEIECTILYPHATSFTEEIFVIEHV